MEKARRREDNVDGFSARRTNSFLFRVPTRDKKEQRGSSRKKKKKKRKRSAAKGPPCSSFHDQPTPPTKRKGRKVVRKGKEKKGRGKDIEGSMLLLCSSRSPCIALGERGKGKSQVEKEKKRKETDDRVGQPIASLLPH